MAREESDVEQLLAARAGDRLAFAAFYRGHALAVYRWFAWRVGREGTIASELTAETFAQALVSLERFRGIESGSGSAWLFGIARNLAREHHRRQRVGNAARRALGMPLAGYLDEAFEQADERGDSALLANALREALDSLPEAQRRAVTLRVVDELDYGTLSDALGTSPEAARLRVSRGLRALRIRLAPRKESP